MNIEHQGAVVVNGYSITHQSDAIVCLELDLRSKYIDTPIHGSHHKRSSTEDRMMKYPVLCLFANQDTLYLDEKKARHEPTHLEFPEFDGFEVFCCDGPYRYTVRLVLIKHEGCS
jgi:hypothetical protein